MNQYGYPESDWKLFRKKYDKWNENYINELCQEYMEILSSDKMPSERFWSLADRIKEDKHKTGVAVRNSRGEMVRNIVDLISCGAITLDDLNEFSDELIETVKKLTE